VLPQRALPHIFGVSRRRLAAAQAGAAAANLLLAVAMVFCAGIAADLLLPHWREATRAEAAAPEPFDATASGMSAVQRARGVFPLDTMFTVLELPVERVPFGAGSPPARGGPPGRGAHRTAGHDARPQR